MQMKRILAIAVLASSMTTPALAAGVSKFTFTEVTFPDGTTGTIQASVKTTKNGTVTVCDYYTTPNDQSAGEFQGTDNSSTDAAAVKSYCQSHFADRALPK